VSEPRGWRPPGGGCDSAGLVVSSRNDSLDAKRRCGYTARCTVRGCRSRATMVARYTDDQGRPLKQRELCDRHAAWLRANRANVRSDPDA
jgi:hypothetical protein